MANEDKPRYFDLQTVQRALPYVSRIMGDLAKTNASAKRLKLIIEGHPLDGYQLEHAELDYELVKERLGDLTDELATVGIIGNFMVDVDRGLVAFLAKRVYGNDHQDQIHICFKYDSSKDHEKQVVEYWKFTGETFDSANLRLLKDNRLELVATE